MNEAKIRKWLDDDYHPAFRASRWVAAVYYNRLPRRFRFLGIVHSGFRSMILISAPGAAAFYGLVAFWPAAVVAIALFVINMLVNFLDRWSADNSISDPRTEMVVRFGDLLTTLKRNSIKKDEAAEAISSCLGIIENFCLPLTKSQKGEIAVSLLLYVGRSRTRMKVARRNPGNERPTNREVAATQLLGHHVCQEGAGPMVIHHIGHVAKGKEKVTSPTRSTVAYKTIFIIPLQHEVDGKLETKGFVSIDCKHPYAFYGNRSEDVIVTCQPVVDQLAELALEGGYVNGSSQKRSQNREGPRSARSAGGGSRSS